MRNNLCCTYPELKKFGLKNNVNFPTMEEHMCSRVTSMYTNKNKIEKRTENPPRFTYKK